LSESDLNGEANYKRCTIDRVVGILEGNIKAKNDKSRREKSLDSEKPHDKLDVLNMYIGDKIRFPMKDNQGFHSEYILRF
jgi:hypothetical protein